MPKKQKRPGGKGKKRPEPVEAPESGELRLNKFIAHSGICSRREADEMIEKGRVKVNGKLVKELGVKVLPDDTVEVDGSSINLESFTYLLLNKPKDTITTTDDEKGRQTVTDLVKTVTGERVYPVGRLDRDTTGVLLLTNDGDLANRLMHPSYTIPKIYEVTTNPVLTDEQLDQLRAGVKLEDGLSKSYKVRRSAFDAALISMGLNEGRNRQIRRTIEALGANVVKLKRTHYAGLTTKGVRTGRWRHLRPKEVNWLREITKLPTKKNA